MGCALGCETVRAFSACGARDKGGVHAWCARQDVRRCARAVQMVGGRTTVRVVLLWWGRAGGMQGVCDGTCVLCVRYGGDWVRVRKMGGAAPVLRPSVLQIIARALGQGWGGWRARHA